MAVFGRFWPILAVFGALQRGQKNLPPKPQSRRKYLRDRRPLVSQKLASDFQEFRNVARAAADGVPDVAPTVQPKSGWRGPRGLRQPGLNRHRAARIRNRNRAARPEIKHGEPQAGSEKRKRKWGIAARASRTQIANRESMSGGKCQSRASGIANRSRRRDRPVNPNREANIKIAHRESEIELGNHDSSVENRNRASRIASRN